MPMRTACSGHLQVGGLCVSSRGRCRKRRPKGRRYKCKDRTLRRSVGSAEGALHTNPSGWGTRKGKPASTCKAAGLPDRELRDAENTEKRPPQKQVREGAVGGNSRFAGGRGESYNARRGGVEVDCSQNAGNRLAEPARSEGPVATLNDGWAVTQGPGPVIESKSGARAAQNTQ